MPAFASFALGVVRVRAGGAPVERVVNAAARRRVILRDVRRESAKALTFSVSYADFYKLRPDFRDLHCKVKILSRGGIPHLRGRLRSRAVLAIGAVACLIVLSAMTRLVWNVRVIGGDAYDPDALAKALLDGGARIGMARSELDAEALDEALRGVFDDISLVTARMRGLTAEVEIVRADAGPEIFERDSPADIVAVCDGVIERVLALEGTSVVKPGQRVYEGDVLIEGRAVAPGGEIEVRALGETLARVVIEGEGVAPLFAETSKPTGNYRNRTLIWLFSDWFPHYNDPPFANYEIASRETEILPFLFIPCGVRRETVYELYVQTVPRSEDEAKEEAARLAAVEALSKIPKDAAVVDKWVEYDMIEGVVHARVSLRVILDIGTLREK